MNTTIQQQLDMVKKFTLGCSVYVVHNPMFGNQTIEQCSLEKIEISIYTNNYANICFVFTDRLGNIVGAYKLEDFDRSFFLSQEEAEKHVEKYCREE